MYRAAANCDFVDDAVVYHDGVILEEKERP